MTAIPFLKRFVPAIRLGVKTMTCRPRKYGEPGDTLSVYIPYHVSAREMNLTIQLLEVRRVRLGDVADRHYIDEGCESRGEFVQVWESIHPGRGFVPDQMVWLHVFKVADGEGSNIHAA